MSRFVTEYIITLEVHLKIIWLFLKIKPTKSTNFSNLFLERNSTCFGQFLCPSSEVFHCTHSNGICHTGVCWQLASRVRMEMSSILILLASCQQTPVWHITLLCVQWKTSDDGQRNCPKQAEFLSKNKFDKSVHLLGFITRNLTRSTVTWTLNNMTYWNT